MYTLFDPEERARFEEDTETVISMRGQTHHAAKTIHYFDTVIRDKDDETMQFEAYTGSYTQDVNQFTVNKIRPIEDTVIGVSGGLQVLASAASINRFIRLAKANSCKKLVIYTKDSIFIENLLEQKFNLCKVVSDKYEVRAELELL